MPPSARADVMPSNVRGGSKIAATIASAVPDSSDTFSLRNNFRFRERSTSLTPARMS
jgi:hypothetical protein